MPIELAPDSTISQRLATWVEGLSFSRIPPEVAKETKLRIVDLTGAMLGGRDSALVQQVSAACFSQDQGHGTPVIGFGQSTGVASAALLQGTMGCVLEFDDSHVATGLHTSTPVVAAAVAKCQQQGLSGKALIQAVLVGNETTCRLGLAAPGLFHKVGFHPTGVLGVFGAAYAVSKLTGAEAAQIVHAAGICGSIASGIMACWKDGTDAKSLHAGWAASSGIQAVHLAAHGVTGPAVVYEGRFGLFDTHSQAPGRAFDYDAVHAGLGEHWEAMTIAPRAYPCGHYAQPLIAAALGLIAERKIDAGEIAEVVCLVADYMVPLLCEPAAEKLRPVTPWHARYSLAFCMAECFVSGTFNKNSLAQESLSDPRYTALAEKVRYQVDPAATDRTKWSGEVQVTLRSGEGLRHRIENMHGTPANPFKEEDILAKFFQNASGTLSQAKAEQVVDRLMRLEAADDVRSVFELLCRARL